MSKKNFIALADMIRAHNKYQMNPFTTVQICALADFCQSQNADFKRDRWLDYVNGNGGVNGGAK